MLYERLKQKNTNLKYIVDGENNLLGVSNRGNINELPLAISSDCMKIGLAEDLVLSFTMDNDRLFFSGAIQAKHTTRRHKNITGWYGLQ